MTKRIDRKRALDLLVTNQTTDKDPTLLDKWVETGDQNLLLSFDEEGQMLLDLAEGFRETRAFYEAQLDVSKAFHEVAVRERDCERTLCDQYRREIFFIKEKLYQFESELENSPSVIRYEKETLLKWIRELL
jgi:hypothetical protein